MNDEKSSARKRACSMRERTCSDCEPSLMIVDDSLPTTMRSHVPSISGVTFSSEMPTSFATYLREPHGRARARRGGAS